QVRPQERLGPDRIRIDKADLKCSDHRDFLVMKKNTAARAEPPRLACAIKNIQPSSVIFITTATAITSCCSESPYENERQEQNCERLLEQLPAPGCRERAYPLDHQVNKRHQDRELNCDSRTLPERRVQKLHERSDHPYSFLDR